jgi:RNA polymerase sigma-70 factor (ECF subfamily)
LDAGKFLMLETSLSLLERLQTQPDAASWQRLVDIYTPLIRGWLQRDPTLREEADDLTQEVLSVLIQGLPQFRRQRPGSFRSWLRTITIHRLHELWRDRHRRPQGAGAMADSVLSQLEDPASELSRQWDQEHDQHVVRRLLDLIEPEFTPPTWQAFRRVVLDDMQAAVVAEELGISVNSVLLAKSRVLKRLREMGRGLID